MPSSRSAPVAALFAVMASLMALPLVTPANGADVARPAVAPPPPPPPEWSIRVTPYAWLTSLNGTQTVRGRTADISAGFIDIVEKSDSLLSLMGTVEFRRGPTAIYGDLVWSKIGVGGGAVRTRTAGPLGVGMGASLGTTFEMGIIEGGITHEIFRQGPLSIELLGGVRHWFQTVDLTLDLAAGVSLLDLEIVGGRGVARSGSVSWTDPLVGARVRYALAPGRDLFARGDIGGFGVGSRFSWQAIGGYAVELGEYAGVKYSGILGYRALYVDYARGAGRTRYEFDMLQHGPILGFTARF